MQGDPVTDEQQKLKSAGHHENERKKPGMKAGGLAQVTETAL